MNDLENINKEIELIRERNKKVETDKAWEISWARKVIIILISYIAIGWTLAFFGFPRAWISAIIPVLAFVISNLSLAFFKSFWMKYFYKK